MSRAFTDLKVVILSINKESELFAKYSRNANVSTYFYSCSHL